MPDDRLKAGQSSGDVSSTVLDRLLGARDIGLDDVRDQIESSWRRSASSGVRPDQFDVPYEPDLAPPERLRRAARPVLNRLDEELRASNVGVVLTDAQARVVDRWAADASLRAQFDRILVAPGFRFSEDTVGTNAAGTALADGAPAFVVREEHFADALVSMGGAAAVITDPHTGTTIGAVGLPAFAAHAHGLMLPMATCAAREIERRLLEDSSMVERVLLEHLLRARRHGKGALVSLNHRTMLTNAAAERILRPSDRPLLWDWASHALDHHRSATATIALTTGMPVTVRAEPVNDGGDLVGALVRFDRSPSTRSQDSRRPTFGWDSLTDTEGSVADLVAQGMTNRQVAARLFLSPHTVGFHLRQIFRKLDITSRVELARLVTLRAAGEPARGPVRSTAGNSATSF
jgi:transcriptional regulator of acetoin/glycerol metabolism